MQLKPYTRILVVALSLAFIAGCSSRGGTQESAGTQGGNRDDGVASTGAAGGGQVSGTGLGGGSDRQGEAGIPQQRTIYFAFDSDRIRAEFEPVLNAHANYLKRNNNAMVVLQGHTDERGTREYNMALSERRAHAVEQYLNIQGVSSAKLEVVGYGEERPAARGQSEEAYAQNRRVVFAY